MAFVATKLPSCVSSRSAANSIFLISAEHIDAIPKCGFRFCCTLHLESQIVRGIRETTASTPLAWVWLYEIRQRNSKLNFHIAQLNKRFTRPWKFMQMHVSSLDVLAIEFIERLNVPLHDQRQ